MLNKIYTNLEKVFSDLSINRIHRFEIKDDIIFINDIQVKIQYENNSLKGFILIIPKIYNGEIILDKMRYPKSFFSLFVKDVVMLVLNQIINQYFMDTYPMDLDIELTTK